MKCKLTKDFPRNFRVPRWAMWKGSGRTLFQTFMLENTKFLLFVITPIVSASLFWNDRIVEYMVTSRQYVRYPPEAERPPSNREELEEALREREMRRKARDVR